MLGIVVHDVKVGCGTLVREHDGRVAILQHLSHVAHDVLAIGCSLVLSKDELAGELEVARLNGVGIVLIDNLFGHIVLVLKLDEAIASVVGSNSGCDGLHEGLVVLASSLQGVVSWLQVEESEEGFTVTNSENVGSLKIKKVFDGMSSNKLSEAQKSQLKFTVKNSNGDLIESFTYADMDPSGEKTISDLPIGDYIVSETGADTLDVNGYAFNETTFNVEGGKTAVSKDNEAVVIITNKYSYSAKCTGEIKVQKVLQGRAWNDSDQFTFTLSADKGTPMPAETTITIRKSDADNIRSFGEIKFIKAGKYTYTVRETKGNIKGVNYDTKAHKVTIEVVDDGNGNLVAGGGTSLIQTVKIINTTGVKTGDENQILLPMAGMLASMLALLLIVIRRRKSRA